MIDHPNDPKSNTQEILVMFGKSTYFCYFSFQIMYIVFNIFLHTLIGKVLSVLIKIVQYFLSINRGVKKFDIKNKNESEQVFIDKNHFCNEYNVEDFYYLFT